MNETEEDDEITSEDYEDDYPDPNARYYGNQMSNFPHYPPQQMNGGHPHVAFVPVPWGNMHPLEQTLYAAQMGPGGQMQMPMMLPPNSQYPLQVMPPQQPQQQHQQPNNHPGGKSNLAPGPPGKDFVEKNKSK